MGVERVLQAAAGVVVAALIARAPAARAETPRPLPTIEARERAAVIDLGPADGGAARRTIGAALAHGRLAAVADAADALAGEGAELDGPLLADAIATAKRAYGELDCASATRAAETAAGLAAARQAAGMPAPELAKAWTYVLLCAERDHDSDRALVAAARVRAAGGAADVPGDLLAKYPDVDVIGGREPVDVDLTSDAGDGAEVWIDYARVGVTPLALVVPAGPHVIAVAKGTRRGVRTLDVARGGGWNAKRVTIAVDAAEQRGPFSDVAARVAGWHGRVPAPTELAWVLGRVDARVAFVRYGDTVEVWGRAGRAEAPRRLGAEDGVGTLAEAPRLVALAIDRVAGWNDHAPDPDRPLVLEARDALRARETPTRWWVYAAAAASVLAIGIGVYAHDSAHDTQHVELRYP